MDDTRRTLVALSPPPAAAAMASRFWDLCLLSSLRQGRAYPRLDIGGGSLRARGCNLKVVFYLHSEVLTEHVPKPDLSVRSTAAAAAGRCNLGRRRRRRKRKPHHLYLAASVRAVVSGVLESRARASQWTIQSSEEGQAKNLARTLRTPPLLVQYSINKV